MPPCPTSDVQHAASREANGAALGSRPLAVRLEIRAGVGARIEVAILALDELGNRLATLVLGEERPAVGILRAVHVYLPILLRTFKR